MAPVPVAVAKRTRTVVLSVLLCYHDVFDDLMAITQCIQIEIAKVYPAITIQHHHDCLPRLIHIDKYPWHTFAILKITPRKRLYKTLSEQPLPLSIFHFRLLLRHFLAGWISRALLLPFVACDTLISRFAGVQSRFIQYISHNK